MNETTKCDEHKRVKIGSDTHVFHDDNGEEMLTIRIKKKNLCRLLHELWLVQLLRRTQAKCSAEKKVTERAEYLLTHADADNCLEHAETIMKFLDKTVESIHRKDAELWKRDSKYDAFIKFMKATCGERGVTVDY